MRAAIDSLSRSRRRPLETGFRVYASLAKSDRGIKAGTYHVPAERELERGARRAARRKGIVRVVTIPEGFSLLQIEPLLAARLSQPLDSVQAATRDTALLRAARHPDADARGVSLSRHVHFADGTTRAPPWTTMVKRFEQVWKPEWTARLDTLHLSRNDVMALAAIVEKEARLAPERPVSPRSTSIAYDSGMLLQADPTVQYALGKHVSRVYYKDLEVDSPYNTYK